MAGFEIKRVDGKRPKLARGAKFALCALVGLAAVAYGRQEEPEEIRLAGEIMPVEMIPMPHEKAVELADALLTASLHQPIAHDVPLCLTDRSGSQPRVVEFIADGLDRKDRIAYEFLEYDFYATNADPARLNGPEFEAIDGTRCGDFDVIYFTTASSYEIHSRISNFLYEYTNRTPQGR